MDILGASIDSKSGTFMRINNNNQGIAVNRVQNETITTLNIKNKFNFIKNMQKVSNWYQLVGVFAYA